MKKKVLLVCVTLMLVLCFGATNAMAIKDQCIELNLMRDNATETMIVWLDSEGWFEVVEGIACCGDWAQYGGSFVMRFMYNGEPILAGTKKRGFWKSTSGDLLEQTGFNTYTIKKIKRKYCEEMMIEDR